LNGEVNTDPAGLVALATRLADRVLYPAATDLDRGARDPAGHLDLFASLGLYGLGAPAGATEGPTADLTTLARVAEALAGGCLATTFVWLQHHGAVRAVAASRTPGLRERWLGPLCAGRVRAGVSQAALRPGPASVTARRDGDGWLLDGQAPWVTGWGLVDVLHVAARTGSGEVLWALVDARPGAGLTAEPMRLAAVSASATVRLRLSGCRVPDVRVTGVGPLPAATGADARSLRVNGSLALGLAGRCAALTGSAEVAGAVDAARCALDAADGDTMPAARAAAAELALRAAGLLAVHTGANAALAGTDADRLLREAGFLLVFGSRAPIRADLLRRLNPVPARHAG
jgi:alkylation response protein AidB-like acyl-CoA dehydrogenase